MIPLLDPREILGINPTLKGVSNKADSLHAFYCQKRRQHPTKVLLVRVGDFYETFGYCAVLLVQYAGLNPMGTKMARAGCPAVNLRRTLADLTGAGFTVLICEEDPIPYGSKSRKKTRRDAGVASPASPLYVHGLSLDAHADISSITSLDQAPIIAVGTSARGFVLYEISLDKRSVKVMEALTEEAVLARLAAGNT